MNVEVALRSGPASELRVTRLTPRERQVFALVARRANNAEIAAALKISQRTAKFHIANILHKFDVANRTDLLLLLAGFNDQSEDAREAQLRRLTA